MRYYIIAGEASGDLHGSNLIRSLVRYDSKAVVRYWGGDLMDAACRETNIDATRSMHISQLAYMGFVEVALHARTIMHNMKFCRHDLIEFHPDAVIYVDYPGFNLKIAAFAHRKGMRNYHYISPNLWAWKKGRIRKMRRILDKLFCILPFEQQFYAENNMPQALYVGHPLLDAVASFRRQEPDETAPTTDRIVALLPGSRRQELKKMLPTMARLARRYPDYQFEVAGMSLLGRQLYDDLLCECPDNITVVYDQTYALLARSRSAIVCSGTATLETALFNVPQVVCYRANAITIAIARMLVSSRIRFISLVNLIANRHVVTELIQSDMTDAALFANFEAITFDGENREKILKGYDEVRTLLGGGGASDRVVQTIVDELNNQTVASVAQ